MKLTPEFEFKADSSTMLILIHDTDDDPGCSEELMMMMIHNADEDCDNDPQW